MMALSIRQPWAWAILHAGKRIENRTWQTLYRGPFLIHAGKGMTRQEYLDFSLWYRQTFQDAIEVPAMEQMERGGIVGRAKIVGCVSRTADPWFFGPYGFQLADVEPLPFTPCKGQLGFFKPEVTSLVAA